MPGNGTCDAKVYLLSEFVLFFCVVLFGAVSSRAVVPGSRHSALQRGEADLDKHCVLVSVLQLS